ncbi:UNVERIFIED_CONTAM: Premnaspirodiene oxygenase [Sesamum radiatum]|uniref:Premnaspirodiene oxygenase n=1 Tax=Sesamum radiatum TaxID=300843 RepID=A0AAW2JUK3_SESRA
MDSGFPLNLTTLALLVPIIFLLIKKWKKSKPLSVKLPPGPKKLPIIGDLHLVSALAFRSFRDLAKQYGPIMHLKLGEVPTIVISSPEIAKEVLREHDPHFADRPEAIAIKIMWYNYINIAFSPYGGYWRQMRKICIMELLSAKNVRSFSSIRNDEVSRMIKSIGLSSGELVNLTDKIFSLTSSITCRAAFGKVCKDSDALIKLLKEGIQMAGGFEIADLFPSSKIISALSWSKLRLVMMRRKLDVILDDIINEHKENLAKMARENGDGEGKESARRGNGEFGNEDLVDVFLRIKESGELEFPIGNDNIKAVIYDMFSAGTDTSSTAIDWTMAELMRNPRVMAKAQAEVREVFKGSKIIEEADVQKLKYLKLVIREALRLHPPVPILPRASREEREISGYTIPAKVRVLVNNWAMQRDPKYWSNPESFEPERFENESLDFLGGDFQYLPFGSGRRMCPGMTFAMASVELPLAQLLYSFNWKLPNGVRAEDLDMIESPGITATRKEDLFVVATPMNLSWLDDGISV